ncbi:hypothetical protein [Rhodopila sp.]|uniref:hypothetical protein n=1 Tax=Rhodopila sp. TaxID=2480087 RepID=UPI003D0B58EC
MPQVLLNWLDFGMTPPAAIEQPRSFSSRFPGFYSPHADTPGHLAITPHSDNGTMIVHGQTGHGVDCWRNQAWKAGSVCAIMQDMGLGMMQGGADAGCPDSVCRW